MSAHYGAPVLGRAQMGTPALWTAPQGSSIPTGSRPERVTRRAIAVAAATLCAPLVAATVLAAIATATGGSHAEMGTLAGTQGLQGTTVAATSPAPAQVSAPAPETSKGYGPEHVPTVTGKNDPAPSTTNPPQRQPSPATRAPAHKAPTQTAPKPPPSKRVGVNPPTTAPSPSVDPTAPGAPTTSGGAGGTGTTGSSSGSSSGPGSPDTASGGD